MANGVKIRHKKYDTFALKWRRCRDVVAGQDAIYAGGPLYLPTLKDELPEDYEKRMKRTPFYNATWRTVAGFNGLLFKKPPTIEAPTGLVPMLEDVTTTGLNLQAFAKAICLEDLTVSRVGVLVDHPRAIGPNPDGSPVSVAQAEKLGLRPSMTMYQAENIINWRYEFIDNRSVLTQVRLLETVSVQQNEFMAEDELRVRVLDLFEGRYRVRVYKESNEEQIGGEVFPLMNGQPLDYIPFWFIGPDDTSSDLDEPIMIDLVDLNIKHYQVAADYEHGCHMTGLPTPVITGYAKQYDGAGQPIKDEFYIGSMVAWVFPDPNATATFLEFTGQGLTALENNLDRKEAQMAAIGARMLAPEKKAAEAAETLAMRHAGESSILSAIAIAVSEGLTKALKVFAEWANQKGEVKFEINRDFMQFVMTPQLLTALLGAVQGGKLSFEAFFDLLKRGDLHEHDLKFEEEQARIDADPSIPKPGDELDAEDGLDDDKPKPGAGNANQT